MRTIENISKKPLNTKFLEKQERCNSQSLNLKSRNVFFQEVTLKTNFTNILKNSIPYYNQLKRMRKMERWTNSEIKAREREGKIVQKLKELWTFQSKYLLWGSFLAPWAQS